MRWWKFTNDAATGWVGVLILFVVQFTWWFARPFDNIPIWILHVVVLLGFIAIMIVYGVLRVFFESKTLIDSIVVKQYVILGKDIILIVGRSASLSYGMVVSIFIVCQDGSAESLCGWGYVHSTTSAGYWQIRMVDIYADVVDPTSLCAKSIRPRDLIIKPYIFKEQIGY